jgi:outer membrane protein OmpA-like peptidoglycan-associated protein
VFPAKLAMFVLASAIAVPAIGQQTQPADNSQTSPSSQTTTAPAAQQTSPSTATTSTSSASSTAAPTEAKEGFWGRMNPMARKKWVKKRLDPMNDRLNELDQVNAKNANEIKDVDSRAQAGIKKAQDSADAANQAATAAGDQAKKANDTAATASGRFDTLNNEVNGLDNYKPISVVEVPFKNGSPVLSDDAKQQLDQMAATLSGHKGYLIEIEAQSPGAGSAGIASSMREAEAVKRYLVSQHQIPVYRMHSVALGNAQVVESSADQSASAAPADPNAKPAKIRKSTVHIKLMQNSLAAQGTASPQGY